MPKWDYVCDTCGKSSALEYTSARSRDLAEAQDPYCLDFWCDGRLVRQPAAPAFKIGGKFTEKNGYGSR